MASVAISQIMSSDLDGEVEANRKILAFTNSVQDAAHQAGFLRREIIVSLSVMLYRIVFGI